jgi:hypothetical protein
MTPPFDQPELITTQLTFYCHLHGTVSECPLTYMSCTEPFSRADHMEATSTACTACWYRHNPRCTQQKDGTHEQSRSEE